MSRTPVSRNQGCLNPNVHFVDLAQGQIIMIKAVTHLGAHGLDEGSVVLDAVHVAVSDGGAVDAG